MDGEINGRNEYRGPPGPEIDEAWRRISMGVPAIRLYEHELKLLSLPIETKEYYKLPEEGGGGYLAMIEVFHLLHCLDSLRKLIHKDYYAEIYMSENATNRQIHSDHCIDILRQHLMCNSDVVPVVFYNNPSQPLPFPDFNTVQMCRKFDSILEWNYKSERAVMWDDIGLVSG
ncbi:hypothetical protein F5884DRAFT_854037 [Xylogone sp. PMI_703]|nr:hypothetical protein F5884DRAFT_854037 [Xylogone sp. PMI_703]